MRYGGVVEGRILGLGVRLWMCSGGENPRPGDEVMEV